MNFAAPLCRIAVCVVLTFLLSACLMLRPPGPTPSVLPPATPPPIPPGPTPVLTIYGWTDENAVMSGICFAAAFDAAGQVFILRSPEAHIRFYGMADGSGLCRHPVTRYPFDYAGGRVLSGLWSKGIGCTARHDVLEVARNRTARTLDIRLHFVVDGDCPYELVRPFWIGLDDVQDYDIQIHVEQ